MGNKTALYPQHVEAGAKIVDFAGWDMPLNYGSQLEEHRIVRQDAGMFDVSHMGVVDISGRQAKNFLAYLLCNDVNKLNLSGKALYSCMLNEKGGVIDDLIVYYFDNTHYRMVINAATRSKDLQWMQKQAKKFEVKLNPRDDLAMLAIQGPNARSKANNILPATLQKLTSSLQPFQGALADDWLVARTGYTGEEGYEIILPSATIPMLWQGLIEIGVAPCGLGARDTLRLEAGLNLYGTDMDETTTPLESNLGWTVSWEPTERDFIGRTALEGQKKAGIKRRLVGVMLQERGVLRNHQKVKVELGEGELTSGSFSPTLGKAIGFARIPAGEVRDCYVDMRGKWLPLQIVKLPFVKNGKVLV